MQTKSERTGTAGARRVRSPVMQDFGGDTEAARIWQHIKWTLEDRKHTSKCREWTREEIERVYGK